MRDVEDEKRMRKNKPKSFIVFIGSILFILIGLMFTFSMLQPGFQRAGPEGNAAQCSSNMKNIASALEMYSTKNKGKYPESLKELTPDYLKTIPSCGANKTDTYSSTYEVDQKTKSYTISCSGGHKKAGLKPGFPQYGSNTGIKTKP